MSYIGQKEKESNIHIYFSKEKKKLRSCWRKELIKSSACNNLAVGGRILCSLSNTYVIRKSRGLVAEGMFR